MAKNTEKGEELWTGKVIDLKVDFNHKKNGLCFEPEFVEKDPHVPGYVHLGSSMRVFNIVGVCSELVKGEVWRVKVVRFEVSPQAKQTHDRRRYIFIDVAPLKRKVERQGEFDPSNRTWIVTETCGDRTKTAETIPAKREVKKYRRDNDIIHIEEITSTSGKILSQKVIITEPNDVYFAALIEQTQKTLRRPLLSREKDRIICVKKAQIPSWPTA